MTEETADEATDSLEGFLEDLPGTRADLPAEVEASGILEMPHNTLCMIWRTITEDVTANPSRGSISESYVGVLVKHSLALRVDFKERGKLEYPEKNIRSTGEITYGNSHVKCTSELAFSGEAQHV